MRDATGGVLILLFFWFIFSPASLGEAVGQVIASASAVVHGPGLDGPGRVNSGGSREGVGYAGVPEKEGQ